MYRCLTLICEENAIARSLDRSSTPSQCLTPSRFPASGHFQCHTMPLALSRDLCRVGPRGWCCLSRDGGGPFVPELEVLLPAADACQRSGANGSQLSLQHDALCLLPERVELPTSSYWRPGDLLCRLLHPRLPVGHPVRARSLLLRLCAERGVAGCRRWFELSG